MRNKNKSVGTLIGEAIRNLCYFLTLLFCVLRVCNVITWKWYWIVLPIVAPKLLGVILLIVAGAIGKMKRR